LNKDASFTKPNSTRILFILSMIFDTSNWAHELRERVIKKWV